MCPFVLRIAFIGVGLPGRGHSPAVGGRLSLGGYAARDSWCPVGAVPPCGWGVALVGKGFSANQRTFVGADILSARQRNFTNLLYPSAKRDLFSVLLVAACPAEASTAFLFDFLPARRGPKPLFLLHRKRKSGSGLRKRKGRPEEMITGYGTTAQSPNPAWVSLG